jgi:hypothetical protein
MLRIQRRNKVTRPERSTTILKRKIKSKAKLNKRKEVKVLIKILKSNTFKTLTKINQSSRKFKKSK